MGKIGLISKSSYIRGLQCPKSLYLYKNNYNDREMPSAELLQRWQKGSMFGKLAWQLFPQGIDMTPKAMFPAALKLAAKNVQAKLGHSDNIILYEATFCHKPLTCILDILVQTNHQIHAYEVKSSVQISDTYINDAAYQYYVMSKSQCTPHTFSMIHIKKGHTLTDDILPQNMSITDVTQQVKDMQNMVEKQINSLLSALQTQDTLHIKRGIQCEVPYHCDFVTYCTKQEENL